MQMMRRAFFSTLGAALVAATGLASADDGHKHEDGHQHGAALHGGTVAMTEEYHFEVVLAEDGLKVYPRSHEDKPVDASRLTGTATFYHPNSPKPWFERKLVPTAASPGQPPAPLGLKMDLSKVPAEGAKVTVKVSGLPDPAEPTAAFTVPFTLADSGALTVAKATQADQATINALKLCPVSHEELGSMGTPLKVSRGSRSTIICCKGCLKEIQANPEKYFSASAGPPDAEHEHHDH